MIARPAVAEKKDNQIFVLIMIIIQNFIIFYYFILIYRLSGHNILEIIINYMLCQREG